MNDNFLINKLIEAKKLELNSIWYTKVIQADINLPKRFENYSEKNIELNRYLYDSIVKLCANINETFGKLIKNDGTNFNKDKFYKILVLINALIYKLNIFMDAKIKQFKLNEELCEALKELVGYLYLFISNIDSGQVSRRISQFYNILNDFLESNFD
jgi:hypothetical protein